MIPNKDRSIRICNLSLYVSDSVMVAVINNDATANHYIPAKMNLLRGNQGAVAVHREELRVQQGIVQYFDCSTIGDSAAAFAAPCGLFPEPNQRFRFGTLQPVTPDFQITTTKVDSRAGGQIQNAALVRKNPAVICPNNLLAEVVQIKVLKKLS